MNPVVHFEMPAEDRKRMSEFYARIFGWHIKQLGPEMGEYVLVQTAETDDHGMLKEPGGKFLGGQGAEFDDIPGVGLYASFLDTEGNRVGMLQPSGQMGAK